MTSGVRRDLTGERFGRLLVVSISHRRVTPNGCVRLMWECLCDCGNKHVAWSTSLTGGTTRSCGCLAREMIGLRRRTHGMSNSPEYESWRGMMERCTRENNNHYKDYGGRGIGVSHEMQTFEGFLRAMGKRPDGHTLERLNVNEGYTPDNCTWIPASEQGHNTSRSWRIEINGETKSLKQWCDRLRLDYTRICGRLRIGWPIWRALELVDAQCISKQYKLSRQ